MKSLKSLALAPLVFLFLLRCSGDKNPYIAGADSGVMITSQSFSDGDTVSIFSTESLTLVLHLKEHIDHVTLRTPANRFWSGSDTVITADEFDREPFTFRFSFYDTGWQEVSLAALRTTGDSVAEKIKVYARSPLHQSAISAAVGDTVPLSTPPVRDDALYVWDFRDGTVIRNNAGNASYIVKTPLAGGAGELYVSDHIHRSPSVFFVITAQGGGGPRITALNDSLRGDTVYAGDVNFTLSAAVTGAVSILTATVNGAQFDRVAKDSSGTFVFSKLFSGLNTQSGPVRATVAITDGTGVTAVRTFWIVYSQAVPRSDRPVLVVLFPSKDSLTANARSFTISGYAANRAGFDSLAVFLRVGDSLYPQYRRLTADSTWQWTFDLAPGWNPIAVMAFEDTSRQGDTLAIVRRAVQYAPGAPDTTAPQLITLLGNGMPLRDGLITADQRLVVRAKILDNGALASVLFNDAPAAVDSAGGWFGAEVALTHRLAGTAVHLYAVDSAGNKLDMTVAVYLDRAPVFTQVPLTARISADSLFSAGIGVADPDGDSVSLTAVIHRPRGDSVLALGGARSIAWRPAAADTGWRTIDVRAWDGYEAADTAFAVYVSPEFAKSIPVRFLTKPSDVPDSLVAAHDTLRLVLRVDPVSGTPPMRFSARVVGGPVLLDTSVNAVVLWAPAAGDTGVRRIELIVRDSLGFADTIEALVTVAPTRRVSVLFEKTGSSGPESVSPVTIRVRLSEPASTTVTAAYAVDWTKSTADSTDFDLPADRTLVFGPGDTARDIVMAIVNDTLIENDEKVVLSLTTTSSGAVIGARSTYTYTIIDDDKTSISFVDSISSASESVSPRTITVRLSRPVNQTVTVGYVVDSASSAGPADYRLDTNRVLTFAPGQTSQNISVVIIDDNLIESDETLLLRLVNPSPLAVLDKLTAHALRIIDNDTPNHVQIFFSSSNSSGLESVTPVRIGIKLSAASPVPVTVSCAVDLTVSTAVSPDDYTAPASSTVTFLPGVTDTAVYLAIVNDKVIESDETIVLTLKNPSAYATLGSPATYTYTIKDDDAPPSVLVEFASSNSSAPESAPATAKVRLSAPSTATITVSYLVDTIASTAQPADYQLPANRTLTFQPGDTGKTISIPIVNDTLVEPNERLVLRLTSPSAYASLGSRVVHTHTIVNDDFALQVTVLPVGSGTVTRTVNGTANQGPYQAGTTVTLKAQPAAGYRVGSWSGPVTTTADSSVVQVRMDSSLSVGVLFGVAPPVITSQPIDEDVTEGQSIVYSVTATGLSLSYQWQRNGTVIQGATGSSYTTPSLTLADNGATYRCVVSNPGGSVTSRAAAALVSAKAPVITTQPSSQTVKPGSTATFTVIATGSQLTYRWQKNSVDISGASSASYTTPAATEADNGALFRCIVSNSAGSVTSSTATLTVSAQAPVITRQPRDTTVNEGQTASFSIAATGTALTYQWQRSGAAISGATAASYATPVATFADSGTVFRCVITNAAGAVTSTGAVLSVRMAAPLITTQPTGQSVVEGQTASFAVAASGARLSYQWQKNGFDIPGATASLYTTPAAAFADSGSVFRCTVRNSAGSVTSSAAMLRVSLAPPTVVTSPTDQLVNEPQPATFSAAIGGTAVTYQWQRNGVNISGATATSYTTAATVPGDSGSTFRLVAVNRAGTVTTAAAVLRVRRAPPVITGQPANTQVTEGQSASFSVTASGSNLVYQWLKNGGAVSGATNASYTTTPVTIADSSALFRCTVTNPAGSVTSNAAVLTVRRALPVVTTDPSGTTVVEGQQASFSVVASGTGLSYQWLRNGTAIPGATAAGYVIPATVIGDNAARFRCIVSNSSGADTSAEALLTVTPKPVLPSLSGPFSASVVEKSPVTFTVTATGGTPPIAYQWQRNGVALPGETGASYSIASAQLAQNGEKYRCIVSNPAGSITSAEATLTVTPAPAGPAITASPVSHTVNQGDSARFSVTATGTPPLSYQWLENGAPIAGDTSPVLTFTSVTASQNGFRYRCTVRNGVASVTSDSAVLGVNIPPLVLTNPAPQTVTEGDSVVFIVSATGTATLHYQWQFNGIDIALNGNGTVYKIQSSVIANGGTYRCVVSNVAGTATSTGALLTVNPAIVAPAITDQPASHAVNDGDSATFGVVASGTAPLSYQWFRNDTTIGGATAGSYTITAADASLNGARYHCQVSNAAGIATSADATLTVNPPAGPPKIESDPQPVTVGAGETATFTVKAVGAQPITYQWQVVISGSAADIPGATDSTYTIPPVQPAQDGYLYQCVVSNTSGSVISAAALLRVR